MAMIMAKRSQMKKGGNDTNNKAEQKPPINLNKPVLPKQQKKED